MCGCILSLQYPEEVVIIMLVLKMRTMRLRAGALLAQGRAVVHCPLNVGQGQRLKGTCPEGCSGDSCAAREVPLTHSEPSAWFSKTSAQTSQESGSSSTSSCLLFSKFS